MLLVTRHDDFWTQPANGWMVGALVCTLLWFVCFGMIGFFAGDDGYLSGRQLIGRILATLAVSWVVLYAVANAAMWIGSYAVQEQPRPTVTSVARTFGFENGRNYPLVLGSRFAGTSGSVNGRSGFFYTTINGTFTPSTGLSLGFTNRDSSYILEVPTSKVTFIQSKVADPDVRMYLKDPAVGSDVATLTTTYGPCSLVVQSLWWTCEKPVTSQALTVGNSASRQGLAPLVAKYIDSVEIVLTPDMYAKILQGG